jgi:hypothetical protein
MNERQIKYYSVLDWLEAGSPLDESFLIVRESVVNTQNFDEDMALLALSGLAALIIHAVTGYRDDTGGSSYHIDSAPSVINDAWSFEYQGFTFSVQTESSLTPGTPLVQISMGAVVTICGEV